MVAHLTTHAQSFENSRRISAGADGTRFSQTVVLTVSCLTNAIEMMTFHNALEAFTFADATDIDKFAFHEHFDGNSFTQVLSVTCFETCELSNQLLRRCAGFLEMLLHSL